MVDLKRAREVLGKKGERMTDEQVMAVVNQLRVLADIVIDQVIAMTPAERKALDKKLKEENKKSVILNKGAGKVR